MTHVIKRILSRTGQCPSRTRFFERFPARPLRAAAWLAPALLIAGSMTAMAQTTTADILGTVSDPTGAIVPNATVKLTDMGTQTVRTIQANAAGEFDFTLLQPGRYSVVVTAPGFSSFKVGQINVNGGDHARADAKLTLGAESQTVEVDSQSPLLQADSVNVTTTITTEAVQNLPTAQRNLTSLVILTPGANEAATVDGLSSGARPDDRRLSSSYSINGEDSQLNNNQIDGTDNNERIIGTIGVKPLLDAIEEVTVQTNDFTPETGRSAGGVISVLTKRGSNSSTVRRTSISRTAQPTPRTRSPRPAPRRSCARTTLAEVSAARSLKTRPSSSGRRRASGWYPRRTRRRSVRCPLRRRRRTRPPSWPRTRIRQAWLWTRSR
jgi:hypothetical protein